MCKSVVTLHIRLSCYHNRGCTAAGQLDFLPQLVLEMSCFYTREFCVTHKINAPDDFVKTVRPAVWDISLCFCSLRYSAAHVVPCSHMGFKHRTRAGAAAVQTHWRGNKHKQHALSCLEVSLVPIDLCCAIALHVQLHTHISQTANPRTKRSWSGHYLLLPPDSRYMRSHCDKWPHS